MDPWHELLMMALAWCLVAATGLLLVARLLTMAPPRSQLLQFPPPRRRRIPWNGLDILMAFFLMAVLPGLVDQSLRQLGLFESLYGDAVDPATRARSLLWTVALAFPLEIALIGLVLHVARGGRPVDVGLSAKRIDSALAAGYLAWLVLAPLTLLIAAGVFFCTPEEWIDQHFLKRLEGVSLAPIEYVLLFAGSALLVPVLEELVFRGVLLPWQLRGGWEAQATVAFTAVVAAGLFGVHETKGFNAWPLVFTLAALPGLFIIPYLLRSRWPADELPHASNGLVDVLLCAGHRRAQPALAICTNGLLFAAMHTAAWPSPVPLLILGVGLAWLRWRTSSLLACITLHVLFNLVATIELVLT